MDIINSCRLCSVSVCDLNTHFNDKCHMDWSKSNLISVVCLDGIYILKPQLDVRQGPFQIYLIRNPTRNFRHQTGRDIGIKFNDNWQCLDNRQYMEIFMDPALMTNVDTLSHDSYPRRFRLAKWSPPVERFPKQCLLTAITIDYQLLIYHRVGSTWAVLSDLSAEYDLIWSQLNLNNDLNKGENFSETRDNLHSLSFCNLCWKEFDRGGPILLAATIPGDIIVWKLFVPDLTSKSMQFDLQAIFRTNLAYINSMQQFNDILIVSTRDGQIVLFDLTSNFDDFRTNHSNRISNGLTTTIKALNLITLPPTILLHRDNIEVNDFYIQPIAQDTFRIVLAKSTNICWCMITYKPKTDIQPASFCISDTFSAVDGLDPDFSLHQTPAIWLKQANDKRAVFIAEDGAFFQLEFKDNHQDTSPDFQAVRTGRIDLTRMVPRGLSTSPGGHLITMISSISLMYEPAKILAPTKLLLIPTVNDKKFFDDCIQSLLDESWYKSEKIRSTMDVCDRMDYLLSIFPILLERGEHLFGLYKTFKEAILDIGLPSNDTQLVKLKVITFLLSKLVSQSNSRMIEADKEFDLDTNVYDLILIYNIDKTLSKLEQLIYAGDDRTYSACQISSIRNYSKWLEHHPVGRAIRRKHINKIEEFKSIASNNPDEVCSICQSIIPFESHKYGICRNGHRFERCARSLLVTNMKMDQGLICEHCKRHYLTYMVWPSDNLWLCLYCQ